MFAMCFRLQVAVDFFCSGEKNLASRVCFADCLLMTKLCLAVLHSMVIVMQMVALESPA